MATTVCVLLFNGRRVGVMLSVDVIGAGAVMEDVEVMLSVGEMRTDAVTGDVEVMVRVTGTSTPKRKR